MSVLLHELLLAGFDAHREHLDAVVEALESQDVGKLADLRGIGR